MSPGRAFAGDQILRRAHRHRGCTTSAAISRDAGAMPVKSQRVIRQLFVEVRIGDERRRIHHDRIAVRRALRDERSADGAARTSPIVDHELMVHHRRASGIGAPDDVGAAAGRKNDHDAYLLRRIRLRPPRRMPSRAGGQPEPTDEMRIMQLLLIDVFATLVTPPHIRGGRPPPPGCDILTCGHAKCKAACHCPAAGLH